MIKYIKVYQVYNKRMDTRLLQVTDLDSLPIKKQKEFIKNMSEGYNQDIYVCPEKKNLVKFKKTFIKKLSKKHKDKDHKIMAMLLIKNFNMEDTYWYVDYDDEKYKDNNYYECYQFSKKDLIGIPDEALKADTKKNLIKMKSEADETYKNNIVCFGKFGSICCAINEN